MRGRTVRTPERVAKAQRLRAEGLTWREIGERLGVSLKTAHEWASDPDGALRDARRASYAGVCVDCGGPTCGDRGPGRARERCVSCHRALVFVSPESLIASIREWADEHGGVPPTEIDWSPSHPAASAAQRAEYATGRWPCHTTVGVRFGSWNAALIAAGFEPHRIRNMGEAVLEEWRKAVRAGESTASIAARYNVTPNAIHQRIRNHGSTVSRLRLEGRARAA